MHVVLARKYSVLFFNTPLYEARALCPVMDAVVCINFLTKRPKRTFLEKYLLYSLKSSIQSFQEWYRFQHIELVLILLTTLGTHRNYLNSSHICCLNLTSIGYSQVNISPVYV